MIHRFLCEGPQDVIVRRLDVLILYLMHVEGVRNPAHQAALILKQRILPSLVSRQARTLVAEVHGLIVGAVLIEVRKNRVAYIPYLAVSPKLQRIGVGRSLVAAARHYAQMSKAVVMETMIHKDNRRSKRFHEKLGFRHFGSVLRRRL